MKRLCIYVVKLAFLALLLLGCDENKKNSSKIDDIFAKPEDNMGVVKMTMPDRVYNHCDQELISWPTNKAGVANFSVGETNIEITCCAKGIRFKMDIEGGTEFYEYNNCEFTNLYPHYVPIVNFALKRLLHTEL